MANFDQNHYCSHLWPLAFMNLLPLLVLVLLLVPPLAMHWQKSALQLQNSLRDSVPLHSIIL